MRDDPSTTQALKLNQGRAQGADQAPLAAIARVSAAKSETWILVLCLRIFFQPGCRAFRFPGCSPRRWGPREHKRPPRRAHRRRHRRRESNRRRLPLGSVQLLRQIPRQRS